MAEAETWSRLSNEKFPGEAKTGIGSGLLEMLASAVGKSICGQRRIAELLKIRESRYRA